MGKNREQELAQVEKEKQKKIAKTLKRAKVKITDSDEDAKSKLVKYVANPKHKWHKMAIKDEFLEDKNFLLNLYNANSNMTAVFPPSEKVSVQLNADFMLEYTRIRFEHEQSLYESSYLWKESSLKWILEKYPYSFLGKGFTPKFVEMFPSVRIVPLIKDCLDSVLDSSFKKEDEEKIQKVYKFALKSVPFEKICDQAREYGANYVAYVPKDFEGFKQIVSAGIENDGFKSLLQLDVTQILENKDLIIKAYEKDGGEKLIDYIKNKLSPVRVRTYMCHGEIHNCTVCDDRYSAVREALCSDKIINKILNEETDKIRVSKNAERQYWDHLFDNIQTNNQEENE